LGEEGVVDGAEVGFFAAAIDGEGEVGRGFLSEAIEAGLFGGERDEVAVAVEFAVEAGGGVVGGEDILVFKLILPDLGGDFGADLVGFVEGLGGGDVFVELLDPGGDEFLAGEN
jgi:hypothetical protein